jgi:hypothetical protein
MQKTILSIVPAAGTIAKDARAYVPRRISVFIGDFGNGRLFLLGRIALENVQFST